MAAKRASPFQLQLYAVGSFGISADCRQKFFDGYLVILLEERAPRKARDKRRGISEEIPKMARNEEEERRSDDRNQRSARYSDDERGGRERSSSARRGRRDLSESGYSYRHTRGSDDDYEGYSAGEQWDDGGGQRTWRGQGRGDSSFGWNERRSGSNTGYRDDPNQRQSAERRHGSGQAGQSYGDMGGSGYVGGFGEQSDYMSDRGSGRDDEFDPDYTRWREEQMRAFDEDYRAFRTERAKKFGSDFEEFRQTRERSAKGGPNTSRKSGQNSDAQH